MTDERNLPKIAEEAALKALDEATRETWETPYLDGDWRDEVRAEKDFVAESSGFPWNAGLRASVKPEYVCIAMRGDQVIEVKFSDVRRRPEYGWSFDRNDSDRVRFITAKIVKDETP